jgi:hypothetical protein
MIKDRIIQLIETKGIPKESFYVNISMTSASFRGNAKITPLNSNAIENILSIIPDANAEWLLTCQGEMLKTDTCNNVSQPPPAPPESNALIEHLKEALKEKDTEIRELNREIGELTREKMDLREVVKKSAVPYKQELISPLMAAEPETSYSKAQQKIPTTIP